ncbi:MAG: hypothetical protein ACQEQG_10395 [Bacillota bacterium]
MLRKLFFTDEKTAVKENTSKLAREANIQKGLSQGDSYLNYI